MTREGAALAEPEPAVEGFGRSGQLDPGDPDHPATQITDAAARKITTSGRKA
jgi:hypothetical protein